MSTAAKGNGFENVVARQLEDAGWTIGTRRHRRGGGDLVATNGERKWLIECKATKEMWSGFGPADRRLLSEFAHRHGYLPMLAWRLPGNRIRWCPESSWPRG